MLPLEKFRVQPTPTVAMDQEARLKAWRRWTQQLCDWKIMLDDHFGLPYNAKQEVRLVGVKQATAFAQALEDLETYDQ